MKSFLILALLIVVPAYASSSAPVAARGSRAPARPSRAAAPRTAAPAPAPAPEAAEKKDETPAPAEASAGEKRKGIITGVSVR